MAYLRLIASMATRQLLGECVAAHAAATGRQVEALSVGGVDAARRVAEGEVFDGVILAADAIDRLAAAGRLSPGEVGRPWVRSRVAVAVPAGRDRPDISSADAVRRALEGAARIGYSTGPSGVALEALARSWGLGALFDTRAVRSPAGVPVAAMLARGEVDIGFQQLSELQDAPGIDLLGPLPAEIEIVTTFSAAVCASAIAPAAAAEFFQFLTGPSAAAMVRRQGMEPAC